MNSHWLLVICLKTALAAGSRGYIDKTHLRGLKTLDFFLVRAGGLCLYSCDF
ncbi:hypothetical protein H6G76_26495 [Nostoc sp. FACHB-152]|uniref:hypothetical protein n=1 Tax=unclassified Nostoc TaxID=2593658 RepID=UPI001682140A|nr:MULTISPECIES: hypothetical protein [unclassified Nostoc]MBD2450617.1 hypothetical protein [Nostoc sp. FACHB-152]MBD2471252.1 hypothetical protein [Nostoc sp. FACHB-145]